MKTLLTFSLAVLFVIAHPNTTALAQNNRWRIYSAPNKSFSVELPAPLIKVESFSGEHGVGLDPAEDEPGVRAYAAAETPLKDSRFGIVSISGRGQFSHGVKRAEALEVLSWYLIGDENELQFMRPATRVRRNGLTGREYFYIKESTINFPVFARGRIFDAGNKIYALIFVGQKKKDLTSVDAERFFASFRLHKRPTSKRKKR
jgi:hypothetical protein